MTLHIAMWAVCGVEMFHPVDAPEVGLFDFLDTGSDFVDALKDFILLNDLESCFGVGIALAIRLFLGIVWFLVIAGAILGVAFD